MYQSLSKVYLLESGNVSDSPYTEEVLSYGCAVEGIGELGV